MQFNDIRTTLQALYALFDNCNSLHTNAFDEAVGLPTETSARIARNTQLILQEESEITRTVDPLAGSYYVENLTASMIHEAGRLIAEVDEAGGMAAAVMTQVLISPLPK